MESEGRKEGRGKRVEQEGSWWKEEATEGRWWLGEQEELPESTGEPREDTSVPLSTCSRACLSSSFSLVRPP